MVWVTAMGWVQSLAWELAHAVGTCPPLKSLQLVCLWVQILRVFFNAMEIMVVNVAPCEIDGSVFGKHFNIL